MRLGIILINLERVERGFAHFGVSLARWHISVSQPQPRFRNPSPGAPELRIFLEGAFEVIQTFAQICLSRLVRIKKTVKVNVVSIRAAHESRRNWRGDIELQFQRIDNRARNFVLERKDSLHLALKCFRPKGESIPAIRQFSADANTISV